MSRVTSRDATSIAFDPSGQGPALILAVSAPVLAPVLIEFFSGARREETASSSVDLAASRSTHQCKDGLFLNFNTNSQGENIMKFLSIYKSVERNTPPSQEEMTRMNALIEDGFKSGYLLAVEGCLPTALGARIRRSGGKVAVTDGPFAEGKEVVGGFAIIHANSKAEAVEYVKQFLQVANDGECELRQVFEAPQDIAAKA